MHSRTNSINILMQPNIDSVNILRLMRMNALIVFTAYTLKHQ